LGRVLWWRIAITDVFTHKGQQLLSFGGIDCFSPNFLVVVFGTYIVQD
jgi:hypothetical protein